MNNWTKEKQRAQANADWFGVPYRIFFDASGNIRVERTLYGSPSRDGEEIVYPQTTEAT